MTKGNIGIVELLEHNQTFLEPAFVHLEESGFIDGREKLVMAYAFKTSGCADEPNSSCSISCDDISEKNLEGADVTGTFSIAGAVGNPLDPDESIPLDLLALLTMEGDILDGTALVDGEIREASQPDREGAFFDEPSAINPDGSFIILVTDFVIPGDFNEMLPGDTNSNITLTGEVYDGNSMLGSIEVVLVDMMGITLNGSFCGTRLLEK